MPPRREPAPEEPRSQFPWVACLIAGGALGFLMLIACAGVVAFLIVRSRDQDREQRNANNLRQIGLAIHNCNDSFGEMPLVSGPWKGVATRDPLRPKDYSLFFCLLPYLEQDNLYKQILSQDWDFKVGGSGATMATPIPTYISPDDNTGTGMQGECSYAANWQLFQAPNPPPAPGIPRVVQYAAIPRSFPDGQVNVIMFAEIYQNCNGTVRRWGQTGDANNFSTAAFNRMNPTNQSVENKSLNLPQYAPKAGDCSPPLAQTPYKSGIWVCTGDASVRKVTPSISITTWRRACAPADGMVLDRDW